MSIKMIHLNSFLAYTHKTLRDRIEVISVGSGVYENEEKTSLQLFIFQERLMTNLWGEFKFKNVSFFLFFRITTIISCGHPKCVYNKPKSIMKRDFFCECSLVRGVQRILLRCCARASEQEKQTNDSILSDLTFCTQQKSLLPFVCAFLNIAVSLSQ